MPLSLHEWRIMLKQMSRSWLEDYALSMGAALAYYTLFSLAPLLLIVIAVAGLVFGEDAARGEITAQLRALMGEGGAQAVQGLLASVHKPAEGVAATVLGAVLLFVGATTVFSELQDALDRIWRAPTLSRSSAWFSLVRARLLSFGMILATASCRPCRWSSALGCRSWCDGWNRSLAAGWRWPRRPAPSVVLCWWPSRSR
jgi:membrane protein